METLNVHQLTQAAQIMQELAPSLFASIQTEEDNDRALEVLRVLMHEIGEDQDHNSSI